MPAAALATLAARFEKSFGEDHAAVLQVIISAFDELGWLRGYGLRFIHESAAICSGRTSGSIGTPSRRLI